MPITIIGTKRDLRDAVEGYVQSVDFAGEIQYVFEDMVKPLVDTLYNVNTYAECSAKTGDGVKNVFEDAARAVLNQNRKEVKKQTVCNLS